MKTIERICEWCKKPFGALAREINRGNAKFCSRSCGYKGKRQPPKRSPWLKCATCGKDFQTPISRIRRSKSGFHFCSRACKDIAQRLDGIKEIHPAHFGTATTSDSSTYRAVAF